MSTKRKRAPHLLLPAVLFALAGPVLALPDLVASKTNNVAGTTTVGNNFTWTITISNTGNQSATIFSGSQLVADSLPNTNISYAAPILTEAVSGSAVCTINMGELSCTVTSDMTLNAGQSVSVSTVATPSSSGTFANPRMGGSCMADPFNDVDNEASEANNVCANTVTVTSNTPDLTAVKTNNVNGVVGVGGSFNWVIQVSNSAGGTTASFSSGQVILTDQLPNAGMNYGAVVVQRSGGGSGTIACAINTSNLSCTASASTVTFPAGAGFTVTIPVTVTIGANFTNPRGGGVCAVDPNGVVVESSNANNSCADSVTSLLPDMVVSKTNNYASGGSSSDFVWQLAVLNGGTATAQFFSGDTILSDDLPSANVSYGSVSSQTSGGVSGNIVCGVAAGPQLNCVASGDVSMPAGALLDVLLAVKPSAAGNLVNPRAGMVCRVDPILGVVEGNENNNNCADTVAVTGQLVVFRDGFE